MSMIQNYFFAFCQIIGAFVCLLSGILACCLAARMAFDWIMETFKLVPVFHEFLCWKFNRKNNRKAKEVPE